VAVKANIINPILQRPQAIIFDRYSLEGSQSLLIGIFDGIGPNGSVLAHAAAGVVRRIVRGRLDKGGMGEVSRDSMVECLQIAFEEARLAVEDFTLESVASGCTGLVCIVHAGVIYSANLGDLRLVVGLTPLQGLSVQALSVDCTMSNPEERQRILETTGGGVTSIIPPLPVTRALGCVGCRPLGMCPYPDIRTYRLEENDRIIVLASQGIFNGNRSMEDMVNRLLAGVDRGMGIDKSAEKVRIWIRDTSRSMKEREENSFIAVVIKEYKG